MRNERGAITIITLTTILFMIAFLISTFVIIANRRQAQIQVKQETQDIYESDVENVDEIYNNYIAQSSASIPISTVEDLFKVGTNEYIVCNDKIYKCTPDANYQLLNDISFHVSDYLSKYPEVFQNSQTWIDIEDQIANGTLTGTFEYNENTITETDTAGKKVEHSEVNYVEYIEGTGTQYIDTGIQPDSNTTFELSIALNDLSSTQAIMGARTASGSNAYNIFVVNSSLRWDFYTKLTTTSLTYSTGNKVKITRTGNQTVFETNGTTQTVTDSTTTFTAPYTMYLFNIHQSTEETRFAKMKLYYFKIYKNGTLVGDFKPALDPNNIPCLYDRVTGQYFYNEGSGTFSYQ